MILWFILSASWAMSLECSIGSASRPELVQLFHKKSLTADDSFLAAYRSWRILKNTPGIKHLVPDNKITQDCIKTSMKRIPSITAKRKICTNSSESGQIINLQTTYNQRQTGTWGMCLQDDLLDYVNWGFSAAIDCVNSLPTNLKNKIELNPISVFKVFNLESAFGFYLYSSNGQGVGQLTTAGASDYLKNNRFNFFLKEVETSTHPSCIAFKKIAKKPILLSQNRIRHCQFLSLSEGLGRNLLLSILHLSNKKWEVISLLKKYGFKSLPDTITDQLVYIAYSRHGIQAVNHLLASTPSLEDMTEAVFYSKFSRRFPYLREIKNKTLDFIRSYNEDQGSTATLNDFKNGICEN